jgi:hypothetical protein
MMSIDVRWLVLIAACAAVPILIRKRREWAEPILVTATVATLLITIFFFLTAPVISLD